MWRGNGEQRGISIHRDAGAGGWMQHDDFLPSSILPSSLLGSWAVPGDAEEGIMSCLLLVQTL